MLFATGEYIRSQGEIYKLTSREYEFLVREGYLKEMQVNTVLCVVCMRVRMRVCNHLEIDYYTYKLSLSFYLSLMHTHAHMHTCTQHFPSFIGDEQFLNYYPEIDLLRDEVAEHGWHVCMCVHERKIEREREFVCVIVDFKVVTHKYTHKHTHTHTHTHT